MKTLNVLFLVMITATCFLVSACSMDLNNPRANEYDVQIIGDSIFDYSGDIQTVLKNLSGKMYKDRSVSGEKMAGVVSQYDRAISGTATLQTVIADGGGNDILQGSADCEFDPLKQECIDVLNYVADKTELLLEDMYIDGINDCVWLGYYHVKNTEAEKNEAIDYAYTLYPAIFGSASLNLYGTGGAYIIDARPHIVPSQIKSDDIHPTYSGSEVLANLIWDVMVTNNTYR